MYVVHDGIMKIPFLLFSVPRFSPEETNTILLSNLRHIIAFSLVKSISWYYLSLQPKLGIEFWPFCGGHIGFAYHRRHCIFGFHVQTFINIWNPKFQGIWNNGLILWFFKPFNFQLQLENVPLFTQILQV